jgi:hypothetical protein
MTDHALRNFAIVGALAMSVGVPFARATDGTHDFARYQVILEKAPFGTMAGAAAEAPQPSFSTRYSWIGTFKEGDQPLMAMVLDKEGNHVHFVAEGDKIGPVTVVKIEKAEGTPGKLQLKQDLEVATLTMESKPGSAATPPPGAPQGIPIGQPPVPGAAQPGARRIPFARGLTK